MIFDDPAVPVIALGSGAGAVLIWAVVLIRSLIAYRVHAERRRPGLVMPIAALVTAIGTLASATALATSRGTISLGIDPNTFSLIASMGRGALLMAGLIVLAHMRVER